MSKQVNHHHLQGECLREEDDEPFYIPNMSFGSENEI